MAAPRMTRDDLGGFFTRPEDGSLWRMIARTDSPTATLERIHPEEELSLFADLVLDADLLERYLPLDTTDGARAKSSLDRLRRVALESVQRQRISGGVGAPIFDGFTRLIREDV